MDKFDTYLRAFRSHFPEREPSGEDYLGVDRIELIHFTNSGSDRDNVVERRLTELQSQGVIVREVDDLEEDYGDLRGKRIVLAGGLSDACLSIRKHFIHLHGGRAIIDMSLVSDA